MNERPRRMSRRTTHDIFPGVKTFVIVLLLMLGIRIFPTACSVTGMGVPLWAWVTFDFLFLLWVLWGIVSLFAHQRVRRQNEREQRENPPE